MAVCLKEPSSLFEVELSPQSPCVQLFNISEFASDLHTRAARLPPVPNAGETALFPLSHLFPEAVFCLPLREKLENSTQSPAANRSGLRSCLLLLLTETNSRALNINSIFWGSDWTWQFFTKKHFPVKKYGAFTGFVDNHQFKGFKNNLDFNI